MIHLMVLTFIVLSMLMLGLISLMIYLFSTIKVGDSELE